MKWYSYLRMAWRNLGYYSFRSWLTSLTIAFAIGTVHVHYALTVRPADRVAQLLESFEQKYVLVFDSLMTTLQAEDLDAAAKSMAQAGVVDRHDTLCAYFMRDPNPIPMVICGQEERLPSELSRLFEVTQGRAPLAGQKEVVLGDDVAQSMQLNIGDSLTLFKGQEPVTVVGLFRRSAQLSAVDLLTSLETLQQLKRRPNGLSFALLEMKPGISPEAAAPTLQALLPDQHVMPAGVAATRLEVGTRGVRIAAASLAAVIASLCAAIALFSLFSAVHERREEFAIMRAMGLPRRMIIGEVMFQGIILGVSGIVKGLIFGELIIYWLGMKIHPMLGTTSQFSELLLPITLGLVVTSLGALWPALRAARVQPQELLHA